MTTPVEYTQLRDAILACPEYATLPKDECRSIREFLHLLKDVDQKWAPSPETLAKAFELALGEARRLHRAGRLPGLVLPEQPTTAVPADLSAAPQEDNSPVVGTDNHALPEESTDAAPDVAADDDTDWTPLPAHPLAAIFPMMGEEQLKAHADDIRDNGQQVPILILDGQVLDGRNTQAACKIAGVMPRYEEWTGQGSPVSVVLSRNAHRRQLTDAQRAVSAARAKAAFEDEARQRRDANLLQNKGSTDGLDPGHRSQGRSAELAARALQVSRDAVNKAAKMLKHAVPDLVVSVEAGSITLDAGALLATLPIVEQRKTLAGGTKQVQLRVKEMREAAKRQKDGKERREDDQSKGQEASTDKADDTSAGETSTSEDSQATEDERAQPTAAQPTDSTTTTAPADDAAPAEDTTSPTTTATDNATTEDTDTTPTTTERGSQRADKGDRASTNTQSTATSKPAKQDTPKVTVNDAIRVVRSHVRKHPDNAVKIIGWIAGDAGVDLWLPTNDAGADVDVLRGLLRGRLRDLGVDDHDPTRTAEDALWGEVDALLCKATPSQDEPADGEGDTPEDGEPSEGDVNDLEAIIAEATRSLDNPV